MTRNEMQHRRLPALALAAALVLVSCNGDTDTDGDQDPVAEDVTENPSEPEPDDDPVDDPEPVEEDPAPETDDEPEPEEPEPEEPEDPFAVPEEIDEAYVQTVMDELMRRDSDLVRDLLQRDLPSPIEEEDLDRLEAIYGGPLLVDMTQTAIGYVSSERNREPQLEAEDFGYRHFDVMRIHSDSEGCVTVLGWWDLTETAVEPFAEDIHIAFVLREDDEEGTTNPTGWQLWDNTLLLSGGEPIPPEEWEGLELEEVLDTSCEREV